MGDFRDYLKVGASIGVVFGSAVGAYDILQNNGEAMMSTMGLLDVEYISLNSYMILVRDCALFSAVGVAGAGLGGIVKEMYEKMKERKQ